MHFSTFCITSTWKHALCLSLLKYLSFTLTTHIIHCHQRLWYLFNSPHPRAPNDGVSGINHFSPLLRSNAPLSFGHHSQHEKSSHKCRSVLSVKVCLSNRHSPVPPHWLQRLWYQLIQPPPMGSKALLCFHLSHYSGLGQSLQHICTWSLNIVWFKGAVMPSPFPIYLGQSLQHTCTWSPKIVWFKGTAIPSHSQFTWVKASSIPLPPTLLDGKFISIGIHTLCYGLTDFLKFQN